MIPQHRWRVPLWAVVAPTAAIATETAIGWPIWWFAFALMWGGVAMLWFAWFTQKPPEWVRR